VLYKGIAGAGIVGVLSRDKYHTFLDALAFWVLAERDLGIQDS
jgi:hypothetical protein